MRIKILFKLILVVILFVGVMIISSYFLLTPKRSGDKTVNISEKLFGWKFPAAEFPATGPVNTRAKAYSDIRDPGGIPQGLPVRLKIPIIGVDTAIEDAFITPDGRMDVPAGTVNVAWFALGPHPGEVGSAVIGGHYGNYEANKGQTVFYNLDKLKVGEKVYIEDDGGNALAFVVRSISSFDRNADATNVFTSSDGLAHLNLITCEGIWNQVNDTYPDRRVVFTDAIPPEGAVVTTKPKIAIKTAPTEVPTPTPSTNSGLTATSTPEEKIVPTIVGIKNPTVSPQVLIASAKSLYATPIDGLITSFFLISIVFISFKIIRR